MKIFGWMHRKFWQNNRDALVETATGPTFSSLTVRLPHDDRLQYFMPLVTEKDSQWLFQDPPEVAPLLHEGLLAIGTFGSPVITLTEKELTAEVDKIAVKETEEATEKDSIMVSTELKKVVAKESGNSRSSGDRMSSASAGSGGKGTETNPLQGFLLELPTVGRTTEPVAERRWERRVSLGELFMRSRVEEVLAGGDMGEEITAEGMNVITKRMLKRRRSVRSNAGDGSGKCDAAEHNNFRKILRIFHRKIHPENAAFSKKLLKHSKHEETKMFYLTNNCSKKHNGNNDNGIDIEQKEIKRDGISRFKCHAYPQSSKGLCRDNSNGNHEHWIKTDADYLVLEL